MPDFGTGYMDAALDRLGEVIATAQDDLADVDFDTIVGTGFSGGVVIPALALAMGKKFALVRKEGDDSHHGPGRILGNLGKRWIFVDDFTATGATRDRVRDKVAQASADPLSVDPIDTTHVGDYYYVNIELRWQPKEA